jgi:AcrR family transcriptional regulator
MFRIKRGRARTEATKLSIASVAKEAGVSAALIHNHYPTIADEIRTAQGRTNRIQRDAKHLELKAERNRVRTLREEIASLKADRDRLASINEALAIENGMLKALHRAPHVVVPMPSGPRGL